MSKNINLKLKIRPLVSPDEDNLLTIIDRIQFLMLFIVSKK